MSPDQSPQSQAEWNAERMAVARALLVRRRRPERSWPALAAAALFAMSATAFALVTILAPAPGAERSALRD
jgi:hypothetical protein